MLWGDVDVAVACGKNNFDDHVIEFKNLQLAASAESEYVLNCLNSRNSLICHPSMHIDGKSGGVGGLVSGEGVCRGLRGRDTARLDASLHDVIVLFLHAEIPEFKMLGRAPLIHVWSVGLNLEEERGVSGGVLCSR